MCRRTCRVADRKLMETTRPPLKTPCAAALRSAPFCSSGGGGIGERDWSSSIRSHQPDQSRTGERWQNVYLFFRWFSVPRIREHSTTEQAVLANDLPAALSFLLI